MQARRFDPRRRGLLIALVALPMACGHLPGSIDIENHVPPISTLDGEPAAQKYAREFSTALAREDLLPIAQRPEPEVPVDRHLLKGRILEAHHDARLSLWTIQTYQGENWMESQLLYVHSDETKELEEVAASSRSEVIDSAVPLLSSEGTMPMVLLELSRRGEWSPEFRTLWTIDLGTKRRKLTSNGNSPKVSPDHSRVAFWRSTDLGFHCLYVWTPRSGEIAPVISMWEADPGSGTSWQWRWSEDSRAIGIQGGCCGFRQETKIYEDIDLIYLVQEQKMVSRK